MSQYLSDKSNFTFSERVMNVGLCAAQASPFQIEVYAEKCSPSLKVSNIDVGGKILKNAITEMVIKKVALSG